MTKTTTYEKLTIGKCFRWLDEDTTKETIKMKTDKGYVYLGSGRCVYFVLNTLLEPVFPLKAVMQVGV